MSGDLFRDTSSRNGISVVSLGSRCRDMTTGVLRGNRAEVDVGSRAGVRCASHGHLGASFFSIDLEVDGKGSRSANTVLGNLRYGPAQPDTQFLLQFGCFQVADDVSSDENGLLGDNEVRHLGMERGAGGRRAAVGTLWDEVGSLGIL